MQLETERLILRDYEERDRADYFQLKSDPQTMYYLQDIRLFSKEEADEDFSNVRRDQKSRGRRF